MALVSLSINVKIHVNKEEHYAIEKNEVSTELTWAEFFAQNGIIVDPRSHYVKGSVHSALLDDKIEQYYRKFGRQMAVYKISVSRKPSHMIKHEKDLEEAIQKSLTTRKYDDCKRTIFPTSSPAASEQDNYEYPLANKIMKFASQPNIAEYQRLGKVYGFSELDGEQEMRAEDTQVGNRVSDTDRVVVDDIRSHFQNRVNSKDILTVRDELKELKRNRNYFRLTRLVSFTAGFLENTFLLD